MRKLILFALLICAIGCSAQVHNKKRVKIILRGYVVMDTLVDKYEDLTILDLTPTPAPINPTPATANITTTGNTTNTNRPTSNASPNVSSQQCAATTRKGRRCSRNAKPGSIYCWQHQR